MMLNARYLLVILFCSVFTGCTEKKDTAGVSTAIPADSVILPDKMVLILADVHTVEASLLIDRNEGLVPGNRQDFYYRGIFDKYHISSQRFDQNVKYYRRDPETYVKIYEKVIVVLEARQKKFSGKK